MKKPGNVHELLSLPAFAQAREHARLQGIADGILNGLPEDVEIVFTVANSATNVALTVTNMCEDHAKEAMANALVRMQAPPDPTR